MLDWFDFRPRGALQWLDPGAFGTLGVGGGFALGAKLCRPDSEVWIIWGDGCCGYSVAEIDTMKRFGAHVISIVGNDAGWTQILREQMPTFNSSVACKLEVTYFYFHVMIYMHTNIFCKNNNWNMYVWFSSTPIIMKFHKAMVVKACSSSTTKMTLQGHFVGHKLLAKSPVSFSTCGLGKQVSGMEAFLFNLLNVSFLLCHSRGMKWVHMYFL